MVARLASIAECYQKVAGSSPAVVSVYVFCFVCVLNGIRNRINDHWDDSRAMTFDFFCIGSALLHQHCAMRVQCAVR